MYQGSEAMTSIPVQDGAIPSIHFPHLKNLGLEEQAGHYAHFENNVDADC